MRPNFFSYRSLSHTASLVPILVFVILSSGAFAQSAQLALQVEEAHVRVTNVTPGGEIVLLSCAKYEKNGKTFNDTQPRLLADDDGDGVVMLPGPVPYVSVWIAVDSKTGTVAIGSREGVPLYVAPIAPALYRKDADEQIVALEKRILRLMLLIVRPEKGAWALRGREGGDGDRDKEANGRLLLAFEDAVPIPQGKEQAPKHLKAGDVIVAVDLGHYDIFVGEVGR